MWIPKVSTLPVISPYKLEVLSEESYIRDSAIAGLVVMLVKHTPDNEYLVKVEVKYS